MFDRHNDLRDTRYMEHNYFTKQEKESLKTFFHNVFFVYVLASLIYLMPDIIKLLVS